MSKSIRDFEKTDSIPISYISNYSEKRIEKTGKLISISPMLESENKPAFTIEVDDTELYITSERDVWSTEQREAGVVVKEKRSIGKDVKIEK